MARRRPLTKKGRTIKRAMKKFYGKKEGERIFFASRQKGTIEGVDFRRTRPRRRRQ
jgi:hypothetical protein